MIGIVIESATHHADGEIVILGVFNVMPLAAEEKRQSVSERIARYCASTGTSIDVSRVTAPAPRARLHSSSRHAVFRPHENRSGCGSST
ncbi:MAG TPA: hypothetical protein VFH06_03920 [Candidatus Saccharimonadales bacterium]|nr:hypothetical protein [Candidatus Saccharimonadales bacterium]